MSTPTSRPPARAARPAALGDLAVVVVLAATALVGLVHVFGGWWFVPAAATGVLVGVAIAWAGARWRWSVLSVAGAAALAYLLVGGPLAYRDTTIAGVLPSLTTVREVVLGIVRVWKGFVTAPTPVVAFPELVAVPLLAGLVATVVAGSIALRARRPSWALLPMALLLVGAILLSTARAAWPVLQGGVFTVAAVAWLGWRRAGGGAGGMAVDPSTQTVEDRSDVTRLRRRRTIGAAVMVTLVGGLVLVGGPVVSDAQARYVLRDQVVPPLDLREYASPLEAFRRYVKDQENDVLFTVSGLPSGGRVRLAVLDTYTGEVMDVAGGDRGASGTSGSFEVAGAALSGPGAADGTRTDVTVTVEDYSGVWVPGVGLPSAVSFTGTGTRSTDLGADLYVNAATGTMVDPFGLAKGDAYTVDAVVPTPPSLDSLGSAELVRDPAPSPYRLEAAAQAARTFVGTETHPVAQVRLIRDRLRAGGVFSDGLDGQPPSPAGHGAWRIAELLSGDRYIGDDEQFAVAASLMIGSLGYASRVVLGFYPDKDADAAGVVELHGTDAHAWVEVDVQGVGWVPVEATPDENQVPEAQDPRSNRQPQATVVQEPPTPKEPAIAPQPPLAQKSDVPQQQDGTDYGVYLRIAVAVGVPLLLLIGPLVLIVVLKSRRRRRRLTAPDPAARISGGWHEVADHVLDLGARITPGATRRETATGLHTEYGGAQMLAVADRADRVVFGLGQPSDDDIARFWSDVDGLLAEVRRSASPWRRLRARFSLRSLRARHAWDDDGQRRRVWWRGRGRR